MRLSTNTLTGQPLRYAVALSLGVSDPIYRYHPEPGDRDYVAGEDYSDMYYVTGPHRNGPFQPDQRWEQAGPYIDQFDICLDRLPDNGHRAFIRVAGVQTCFMDCWYSTKLQTAMRCLVASVLGLEVEVPDFLVGKA